MRNRLSTWVLIILLAGALSYPAAYVDAEPQPQEAFPQGASRYFNQTGHYVSGPFLEFFDSRGGVRVFGYPQTRVFYDPALGLWVQYFDNARMEWHPGNADPYKVQLGLLAEILGYSQPPLPSEELHSNSRFRRVFRQTGHVVSFAFLDFYDNNGGLDIFGYPISEPMLDEERGYIVQYFQRMRMEWHPERSREDRVVLGALGNQYMFRYNVPSEYREREEYNPNIIDLNPPTPAQVTLRVWAAVRHAITGRDGNQTIFVYVTDARREPLAGANVVVTVRYPSDTVVYSLSPTNAQGLTDIGFEINAPPPGRRVVVDVNVTYEGVLGTAQTSFLPWW
ncbi:MAG: carboxypeptidase regulatory-like domain-containing protein [Anaerolineae bacterium]|nr:carboxypeptidase regulatory-like domain-containing protein [Anaerolineae bacterium]